MTPTKDEFLNSGIVRSDPTDAFRGPDCPICLDGFSDDDVTPGSGQHIAIRVLPCGHIFGDTCLREWISRSDQAHACIIYSRPLFRQSPAQQLMTYLVWLWVQIFTPVFLVVEWCQYLYDKTFCFINVVEKILFEKVFFWVPTHVWTIVRAIYWQHSASFWATDALQMFTEIIEHTPHGRNAVQWEVELIMVTFQKKFIRLILAIMKPQHSSWRWVNQIPMGSLVLYVVDLAWLACTVLKPRGLHQQDLGVADDDRMAFTVIMSFFFLISTSANLWAFTCWCMGWSPHSSRVAWFLEVWWLGNPEKLAGRIEAY